MDLPLEKVGKTTSASLTKSHAFEGCVSAHVALGAFFCILSTGQLHFLANESAELAGGNQQTP